MAIHVAIYLVAREERTVVGIWCPKCLKPSGIEVPFDRISESGVSPGSVVLRKCYDCDTPLPREGDA